MRINWYLRGIDLIDIEFHAGSKGLYLDISIFQPREELGSDGPVRDEGRKGTDDAEERLRTTGDLSGTAALMSERADGMTFGDDQPMWVREHNNRPRTELTSRGMRYVGASGQETRIGF